MVKQSPWGWQQWCGTALPWQGDGGRVAAQGLWASRVLGKSRFLTFVLIIVRNRTDFLNIDYIV